MNIVHFEHPFCFQEVVSSHTCIVVKECLCMWKSHYLKHRNCNETIDLNPSLNADVSQAVKGIFVPDRFLLTKGPEQSFENRIVFLACFW